MPAPLPAIVQWLDEFLSTASIGDYSGAHNGLQVENRVPVGKIGAAVDASEAALISAVEGGCQLLLVHHGLLWQGAAAFTGPIYRKLRLAMERDLAIYSSHLPLDLHPEVGNNAVLARLLGFPPAEPFLPLRGQPIGLVTDWAVPLPELLERVGEATGSRPQLAAGGPGVTRRVGIVTGGAGSEVAAAAAAGVDTFITGEAPHWAHPLALELGVNLILAGHYATETFGVRALAERVATHFGLEWEFFDHPSGL
jgi:dinuclear metal center YbgI/SA1388 family protein